VPSCSGSKPVRRPTIREIVDELISERERDPNAQPKRFRFDDLSFTDDDVRIDTTPLRSERAEFMSRIK